MAQIPAPMENYEGEMVLFATGYKVKGKVIRQHFLIGFILSLTIIGLIVAIPIISRGTYLRRNPFKSIILTETKLYEVHNGKITWYSDLSNIKGIRGRTTTMGLFELHIELHNENDRYIKGNFYETELLILISAIQSRMEKLGFNL